MLAGLDRNRRHFWSGIRNDASHSKASNILGLSRLGHGLTARAADVEARSIDTLTTSDAFGRGQLPGLRVRLIVLAEQLVATVTVRTDVVRVGAHSHDLLFQTSLDVVNTGLLIIGSASFRK